MAPSMITEEQPFDLVSPSLGLSKRPWELMTFPKGQEWPALLKSPLAWEPKIFEDEENFVYKLDAEEIMEITSALNRFKVLQIHYSHANKSNFVLPALGPKLKLLSIEVHSGKGFFILRGLNPKEFTREENVILFLGISNYVASRVGRQSLDEVEGRMFSHITPAPVESSVMGDYHPAYSTSSLPFHSDVITDVLALYCLNSAEAGGRSSIASSWKVYNELARTRPDIIVILAMDDWVHYKFNSDKPYFKRPLLHLTPDGKPILNFTPHDLTGEPDKPRPTTVPPLTSRQVEALKVVDDLARKYRLETSCLPGDMRFINNFANLHSRAAFKKEDGHDRHLLRLWLRSEEHGWQIPTGLKKAWSEVFEPIPGVTDIWNENPDARHMIDGGTSSGSSSTSCG